MTHAPKGKFPLFQAHLASSVNENPLYILIQKLLCLRIYYLAALNSKRREKKKKQRLLSTLIYAFEIHRNTITEFFHAH